MSHAIVSYGFGDIGDQHAVSKATREAIRKRLRKGGLRRTGEAMWEMHGDLSELDRVLSDVLSEIERRGGQTLRDLSITVR